MFRRMVRQQQALSDSECFALLASEKRGVLSVQGDDGYPYGMPLDYWFDPGSCSIFFHSAKYGYKIDAIQRCSKVSFCVCDEGQRYPGEWPLHFKSVIVFGRIHPVEDQQVAMEICRRMSYKFTPDNEYIEEEIRRAGNETLVLELCIEYLTGKAVEES